MMSYADEARILEQALSEEVERTPAATAHLRIALDRRIRALRRQAGQCESESSGCGLADD